VGLDAALRTILDRFTWVGTWLNTVLKPWGWALACGEVSSAERLILWGYNATTLAAGEPVWEVSTDYTWATADQTLTVQSTSANDDDGNTGANTVRVWWMNAAGVEATVDVTMNGVGAVVTAIATARRVNKVQVLTVGAAGTNVGTITVYWTDGATIFRTIPAGRGHSEGLIQTVPSGYQDVINFCQYDIQASAVTYTLFVRKSSTSPWLAVDRAVVANTTKYLDLPYYCPLILPAGTDYYVRGASGVGTITSGLIGGWREVA
jgi:hypothetical protein